MNSDEQFFPEAAYAKTGLQDYDGNPLIEALPPILSDEEVAHALWRKPPYPSTDELNLGRRPQVPSATVS